MLLIALMLLTAQQPRPNGLYAIFNTSMGPITARLYEKDTPVSVQTFVKLASRHLFDNITFHRVVRDEMIQSGVLNCNLTIRDEILPGLRFEEAGKLAMANTGKPDTGGCQFFITVNAMRPWNGQYTIFGYVVEGMGIVTKINHGKLNGDKPIEPVKLINVAIERIGSEPKLKR
jgi:cyclophilin family peptidyl-prolyl cis-trans isomerase